MATKKSEDKSAPADELVDDAEPDAAEIAVGEAGPVEQPEPGPIESPDQPPLKVKQYWVVPRDMFERMMEAGKFQEYCDKYKIAWRGGVHQGDITIL